MAHDFQDKLATKQLTRREFLQLSGAVVLAVLGVGKLITLMNHARKGDVRAITGAVDADAGFGNRKFGA